VNTEIVDSFDLGIEGAVAALANPIKSDFYNTACISDIIERDLSLSKYLVHLKYIDNTI
jgi:hypothetical protein